MALRFFNSFSRAATAQPMVTFFHKPNSKLSNHLLERLSSNSRYTLDVRSNKLPLYRTYRFVHEECINIHPQNTKAFEAVFPSLLASNHLFCDHEVKNNAKNKQFIADLDLESEADYLEKISTHTVADLRPFAIDWENRLLAYNDEGLDRIMQNYYQCGTQKSKMEHLHVGCDFAEVDAAQFPPEKPNNVNHAHSAAMLYMVHPHMAEFADLF